MAIQVGFTLLLFGILAMITWFDFRTQTIPDVLNGTLTAAGIAAVFFLKMISLGDAALGLVLGFTVPLALRSAFRVIRGVDGLGMGDVKFLGAAGLWVGAVGLPWLVLLACISGLAFALAIQIATKGFSRQTRLAFGPHLALGLFATWMFNWYGML